ncbi:hypothetical protein LTR53_001779 [Teratosphaeriaceae sp. CCFEE 6253]|nr:hypothetical protein LTR53_001779 [Teratosphaeriaceae sp. CCFEE 6253]
MADEPRKRSRFDQTEPPRKSRFDRRSRSPTRGDEGRGSGSPVTKSAESGKDSSAAAAAAAAAAKINAQIHAKKGIQHVEVPPIRAPASPTAPGATSEAGTKTDEIYTQDGDYIKDVEINDLRNRYTLTKGSTQKMIKEKTGADVTTRGNYYPDKSMATAANPPLYLHITSITKDGLEKAVQEIDGLMQQDLPNLVDERRFRRRDQEAQPPVERDHLGRRKWPEERIPIDLEPIPGFNLRAQVVGAGGSYVKHIQTETRCRVQIKGRGSGFMEHDTGRESDEAMYLHVAGPDPAEVENAKNMCVSLLESVKESYDSFKERGPRGSSGGGDRYSGGDRGGYGGGGGDRGGSYNERDRNSSYGGNGAPNNGSYGGGSAYGGNGQYGGGAAYGQPAPGVAAPGGYGGGGAMSPSQATGQASGAGAMSPSAGGADQAAQMQAWAAYFAANPAQDPYAAYGGYGAAMAPYMQNPGAYYQGQGVGIAQSPGPLNGGAAGMNGSGGAPPPPPPGDAGNGMGSGGGGYGEAPPPPPPPPGASNGGYSSVSRGDR